MSVKKLIEKGGGKMIKTIRVMLFPNNQQKTKYSNMLMLPGLLITGH